MPLVAAIRTADPNNTRAVANLAIGTAWAGVETYVGAGRYRAEVTVSAVQAGTLEVLQGETAATCTTVLESIAIAAGTVGVGFAFCLTSQFYVLRYTQGGIAGNVTIGTMLDPREYTAVRKQDPNNSRALAALGAGLTWTGVGTYRSLYARVDVTIVAAATGTLLFQESDDGVTWATIETWACTAATHAARFRLSARFYRFSFTDTGGGGNLTVVAVLDPRTIDERSVHTTTAVALGGGGTATYPRPVGARSIFMPGCTNLGAIPEFRLEQLNAAGTAIDYYRSGGGVYHIQALRSLRPLCTSVRVTEVGPGASNADLFWYHA